MTQPLGKELLTIGARAWAVVSGILHIIHPSQYVMARAVQKGITGRGLCREAHRIWPTVFNAVTMISNRETPFHRDSKSSSSWYDVITSVGPYDKAPLYLSPLAIRTDNRPGTVCAFSGVAHRHAVRRIVYPRVCFAWYQREDVRRGAFVDSAGYMTQKHYNDCVGPKGIRFWSSS